MPHSDRPLTIATYAAGASLAAVTLVYVFAPTFFLDDHAAQSSKSARKVGVVGLANRANDCFINSVLQALAGLPALRAYLIREVHRRSLDVEGYASLRGWVEEGDEQRRRRRRRRKKKEERIKEEEEEERRRREEEERIKIPEWKVLGLQEGLVTKGLKDVLDALNERPIWKKTISAGGFIRCVEGALRTRISRTQQDAQEFLQVVLERLGEEWSAGRRVRRYALQLKGEEEEEGEEGEDEEEEEEEDQEEEEEEDQEQNEMEEMDDFPLLGKLSSTLECSHCHFTPKPSISSFLTLTLTVPHNSTSTTLSTCFDSLFQTEQIEDFKCDRCRLEHALALTNRQLQKTSLSEEQRSKLGMEISALENAIATDPETPPENVTLPPLSTAPTRRIARHTKISSFPALLSIHLSRSVWDPSATSSKNLAKVSFPEILSVGSLLDRKEYRLLCVVTHKGGHNSGHYESFRRQVIEREPFSTPIDLGRDPKGVYGNSSPSSTSSPRSSPRIDAVNHGDGIETTTTPRRRRNHHHHHHAVAAEDVPLEAIPTPGLPSPPRKKDGRGGPPERQASVVASIMKATRVKKGRGGSERWWRISDEKVRECKTSEVLGMQREVYLLFYERVEAGGGN